MYLSCAQEVFHKSMKSLVKLEVTVVYESFPLRGSISSLQRDNTSVTLAICTSQRLKFTKLQDLFKLSRRKRPFNIDQGCDTLVSEYEYELSFDGLKAVEPSRQNDGTDSQRKLLERNAHRL